MEQGTLEKEIAKLPDSFKLKLEGYIDALLDEADQYTEVQVSPDPKREFGGLKGFVTYMTDDFDKSLEELSNQKTLNQKFQTPKSGFGSGKGIFGKMSDDFDEPIDEMKEYM